jgi:membrane-associated protease RseP (regulator of RpoE activity)
MKLSQAKPTLIAASIGLLLACTASAQDKASDPDKARELAAARADLDRAAKRVGELSREQGGAETFVFERRFESHPVLGVVLAPDSGPGVRIAAVTPESGAAKAGLRSGDRITAIDGKNLSDKNPEQRLAQAREKLRSIDIETPVALTYERDGRSATVKATPQPGDRVLLVRDQDGSPVMTRHIVTGNGAADWNVDGDAIEMHVARSWHRKCAVRSSGSAPRGTARATIADCRC